MRKDRTRAKLKASGKTVKDIIMERNIGIALYATTIMTVRKNGMCEQYQIAGSKFKQMMEKRAIEFLLENRERLTEVNNTPSVIKIAKGIKKQMVGGE